MYYDGSSMADYHIHPNYSFDASGSLDEFCRAALKKGLREICFTTHFDTDPRLPEKHRMIRINGRMVANSIDIFEKYVSAVGKIEEKYALEGLVVNCGVEVGYYPGCEEETRKLFDRYNFHYRLGAVHQAGEVDICNDKQVKNCSSKISLDDFADQYFKELAQMVESGLFNALAHFDMYKKYGLKYYGDEILSIHQGRIDSLLEAMIKANIGLEINTSSLRNGHSEYYPMMDILNRARKAGVSVVAVGSDAHKPDEVGYDFEAAAAIAYDIFPYIDE